MEYKECKNTNCVYCGTEIEQSSPNRVYCDGCKVKVNAKHKEKQLALSKLKTALKAKKIAVMKGQKAADYFTIVKDPDDEWGSKSQMNKGGLDECLKRSAFTEGTIIKNNSSGVFYLVVSDEVKPTRAKARRIQKLLELERVD